MQDNTLKIELSKIFQLLDPLILKGELPYLLQVKDFVYKPSINVLNQLVVLLFLTSLKFIAFFIMLFDKALKVLLI